MSVHELHQVLNLFRGIYKQVEEDWDECARSLDLTSPQLHILWVLSFEDGLNLSDISQRSLLHISTVSDLVKRMERKGLVVRKEGLDRRKIKVHLSQKGWELQQRNEEECLNYFKITKFMDDLSAEQREKFIEQVAWLAGELREDRFVEWVKWSSGRI